MPMLMALKGALMFLGVIALLILVVIGGEMAIIIFLHIGESLGDDLRQGRTDNQDTGGREWWEDTDH